MSAHVLHEKIQTAFTEKDSEELYLRLLKGKKTLFIWSRLNHVKLGASGMYLFVWFLKKAIELKIKSIFYVPGLELDNDEFARRLIYSRKLLSKKIDFELSYDDSKKLTAGELFNKAYQQYGPGVL